MIFVNLPVRDLQQSIHFFAKLGFPTNPQFTDDTAACVVISDTIYVMLLTHAKFRQFTKRDIVDASQATEVLTALSCPSRTRVDEIADAAIAAGGTPNLEPQDYGFMYQRSISDLDGHIWEFIWMDPAHVEPPPAA